MVYEIKICDWYTYNPRGDKKRSTWFRLNHDLFLGSKWSGLLLRNDLCAFLYLCSVASEQCTDVVKVSAQHVKVNSRIKLSEFLASCETLEKHGLIQSQCDIRGVLRTNERTNDDNVDSVILNFELLYRKYPRKEGKTRGIGFCKTNIKSEEDYSLLSKAIDRYANHCVNNKIEISYIKHFSTFMNSWRDWLDQDAGTMKVGISESDRAAEMRKRMEESGI